VWIFAHIAVQEDCYDRVRGREARVSMSL